MFLKCFYTLVGAVNLIFCAVNLLVCSLLVYLFAFFKLCCWGDFSVKFFERFGTWIAKIFAFNNAWFFGLTMKTQYELQGDREFSLNTRYLLIANHQSWADILVLEHVFAFKIPMLKFFLKKELIFVPIVGTSCWALNFPFMKRYSKEFLDKNPHLKGKDLETTRKACQRFKLVPATLINFVEGTRFTQLKHKQQNSPYRHLLKPKAGGMAFTLDAMGDALTAIIDVTIIYPESQHIMWDYFCGRLEKIVIDIHVHDIPDELRGDYDKDEAFKIRFQSWLNALWAKKDEKMSLMKGIEE